MATKLPKSAFKAAKAPPAPKAPVMKAAKQSQIDAVSINHKKEQVPIMRSKAKVTSSKPKVVKNKSQY